MVSYEQRLRNNPDLMLREDFGAKLDASVRGMYAQLWREAQAKDNLSE
jgi:hypothetical protein